MKSWHRNRSQRNRDGASLWLWWAIEVDESWFRVGGGAADVGSGCYSGCYIKSVHFGSLVLPPTFNVLFFDGDIASLYYPLPTAIVAN